MNFIKTGITLCLIFCATLMGRAQELNCMVQVIAPTLQSSPANQEIIESLQQSVHDFVNNTKWTNDIFKDEERIECSILINISARNNNTFTASIQVSSSRPVYNSNFKTRLFNYKDASFQFEYLRNTAVVFTPDRHQSNLADVLAFYCYMVIGYDYDTFSLEGGTPYFNKAQQIVTNCQNAPEPGWKPSEGPKNRFSLVANHLQSQFKPLRKCFYNYHINGFDLLYSKRDEALNNIMSAIESLKLVHNAQPNSFNLQLFFAAKVEEITGLFKGAPQDVRSRIYTTLVMVDPGNNSKYNKMKQGK